MGGVTCDYWRPEECEGTPVCPPRCPRFADDAGKGLLAVRYRPEHRSSLEDMYEAFPEDQQTMGVPPVGGSQLRDWLDGLIERGTNVVALDDDTVVGHGIYAPEWDTTPELALFVHLEHQGRGIGTELSRQLIADAAARGLGSLRLTVDADNEAALAVYRSLGFRVRERRGNDVEMVLPFCDPVAQQVRRPPAER